MVSRPSHWTHVFTKDTPGALDALQQGGLYSTYVFTIILALENELTP